MPQISVSRRHLVLLLLAMIVLAVAIPLAVPAATQTFTDVPPSDWAFNDVEWLAAAGLTNGCGDGTTFCPDDDVTRREMATFIRRLSGDDTTTITGRLDALEAENAALKALLAGVSRDGDTPLFTGMNLQVVNGEGFTATYNKVGNIIIDYNEAPTLPVRGYRDGSHDLIIGTEHSYTTYAGIVTGAHSTSIAPCASVTGGYGTPPGRATRRCPAALATSRVAAARRSSVGVARPSPCTPTRILRVAADQNGDNDAARHSGGQPLQPRSVNAVGYHPKSHPIRALNNARC